MYRHPKEIIDIAIREKGSRTQLAAHLEISTSTLDKVRFNDSPIPAKHAVELSRLTGVPLHYVNPDIFDPDVFILSPEEIELIRELRNDDA